MDLESVIYGALGGSVTVLGVLYGYARMQGFKLLPDDLGETAIKLQRDYDELLGEIRGAIGNISITEVGRIFSRAQILGKDGFTAAEAQELGIMIIDAAKD